MHHKWRAHVTTVISLLCILFYFTPWLFAANHTFMGLYILSIGWFLIAWVIAVAKTIGVIQQWVRERVLDKHKAFSVLLIALCYAALIAGMMNDYFVTV